ncbi:MAG TPA: RNB domain-containing ribonuclease [Gemmatimonadaceae bacterium]|nr:RNB domain-containing ribonuclease [Gemmatimonadaceae bacterium]
MPNLDGECSIPHHSTQIDFVQTARRVLRENGFDPDFGQPVEAQVESLREPALPAPGAAADGVRDLRALLWSSIDNTESRDLDQVEVVEQLDGGAIRVLVGIADVDVLVGKGTPADEHARGNATSVYTGVVTFPMLPERLSTGLTSLNEDEDRRALVVENVVEEDGTVEHFDVYRALVRNRAKLAYEGVGAWLEHAAGGKDSGAAALGVPEALARDAALAEQLRLQREAARRLKAERVASGALELDTIEATPVTRDGRIVDLRLVHKNLARDLIEDFMIASNVAIAKWLEARGRSGIRRVVREPERWQRIVDLARGYGEVLPAAPDSLALAQFLARRRAADPLRFPDLSLSIVKLMGPGEYALDLPGKDPGGHFGLAAHDYSHATAPNRRYADLITQRLVKATLAGAVAPYANDELAAIAAHCTEREDAARKVERTMRKVAAAVFLADRIGETFDAIVTGDTPKGTYVRLLHPPAEGRVVRGAEGMDVGDRVRVRLVSTDAQKGWIDFVGIRE